MNPTQAWNCGRCGALFKDEAKAHACCKCKECATSFRPYETYKTSFSETDKGGEYRITGDDASCEVCRAAANLRKAEDYYKAAKARRERAKP